MADARAEATQDVNTQLTVTKRITDGKDEERGKAKKLWKNGQVIP